ncbi:hypothetical protein AJ79_08178 [Helicocarpus griseus UAMH5409]|uniref:Nuclear RNA binding protein n=1 Tax=Helicocarpus griseus UAMH5409 TaxID=1447875 RepID=A0A2B7WV77_9EURO|nr:hypothetical protein AJ79_08178 [Helicocarpus griseus UAMH5409]
MAKEKQRDRNQAKTKARDGYGEVQEQRAEIHHSAQNDTGKHIDHHRLSSTPTHRYYVGSPPESTRAPASPETANGAAAGLNSSAKRKLSGENFDHGPEYDYDYDYDDNYDQDTPKGSFKNAEKNGTTNSLEVPGHQYGNSPTKSSPKRMRSNEWLLRSREASPGQTHGGGKSDSTTPRLRSRRRQSLNKSQCGSRSVSASASASAVVEGERRSRFVEGSMNDRVSEKPPSIYIGEEVDEAIDRYMSGDGEESAGGGASTPGKRSSRHGTLHTSSTANSMNSIATDASSTKSGIVRFGQALVSAFNPFGVWNNVSEIWNGQQEGGIKATTSSVSTAAMASKEILSQRQAQAEKAYAELKASGYQGTVKSVPPPAANRASTTTPAGPENSGGVKKQTTTDRTPQHKYVRSISSTFSRENLLTPSKSAIRASFQDLRKAASYINIPTSSSAKRMDSVDDGDSGDPNVVRKQVSRRELEKQRKLKKKVSNLESQLEKARRQLSLISGDVSDVNGSADASARGSVSASVNSTEEEHEEVDSAPPVPPPHLEGVKLGRRKKFVPGALPSLPSERILLGQMADKPTNRSLFTGRNASSFSIRDTEGKNATQPKLRNRRQGLSEKGCLSPLTSSRGNRLASAPSSSSANNRGDDGTTNFDDENTDPMSPSRPQKSSQTTTSKGRVQKAASASFPSSTNNNKNVKTASTTPSIRDVNSSQPHSTSTSSKPKRPPRRRSSTTFPHRKHVQSQFQIHDDEKNHDTDANAKQHKSRRNGSGALKHANDVPPVPPLPVNIVTGVSARRRTELRAEKVQAREEFDWPEDFL